jgi:hypothetical protein
MMLHTYPDAPAAYAAMGRLIELGLRPVILPKAETVYNFAWPSNVFELWVAEAEARQAINELYADDNEEA